MAVVLHVIHMAERVNDRVANLATLVRSRRAEVVALRMVHCFGTSLLASSSIFEVTRLSTEMFRPVASTPRESVVTTSNAV